MYKSQGKVVSIFVEKLFNAKKMFKENTVIVSD